MEASDHYAQRVWRGHCQQFRKRVPKESGSCVEPDAWLRGVSGVNSKNARTGAVADVYQALYHRLVAVVGAVSGDREEAEEAVQDAFIRLIARWETVSAYDDIEAWLRKVALGYVWKRHRKLRNALRAIVRHGAAAEEPPPSGESVDLRRSVMLLPMHQREALVLVHVVGLSVDEAARELGLPVGTVKSRLSRGRAALLPLMSEELDNNV
jgi:RNA polymerase sigma factor (sigma-70 family)